MLSQRDRLIVYFFNVQQADYEKEIQILQEKIANLKEELKTVV